MDSHSAVSQWTRHRAGGQNPGWTRATVLLSIALVSCSPQRPSPAGVSSDPSVPLHVLARNIESYRGQSVRTCGTELLPITQADGTVRSWSLRKLDPTSSHGFTAYVIVPACAGRRPPMAGGCVVGRVAREDGSLDIPEAITIGSHLIGSQEWRLHPQCLVP